MDTANISIGIPVGVSRTSKGDDTSKERNLSIVSDGAMYIAVKGIGLFLSKIERDVVSRNPYTRTWKVQGT